MMACLDTTILIDAAGRGGSRLRGRARENLASLVDDGEALTTTRFTVAELWVGIERAEDRQAEIEAVERMLRPLIVLDFDEVAARVFGRVTARLQARGTPRGDMDVLIAAVALVHGERVVTRNTRHFDAIPGLAVESY
jgi:tRNA(fMet)-specific endonuclease VapC